MKKLLVSLAAAGLLISAGAAFSQNPIVQKDAPSQATTPSTNTQTNTNAQIQTNTNRRGSGAAAQTNQTNRTTIQQRAERSGDRDGVRGREGSRSSVNIRVGSGDRGELRHRRGHRINVYASGCRTIIVKRRHHGHTVIKRIRRCG
jgi:hypothetical protein